MTIKEMELLSGMTRANIRFYENEGLLAPRRQKNGYRAYSESDLEMLKKIKLLRALRIPLEDIKRLQSGEQSLARVLDGQLAAIRVEEQNLRLSRQICESLRSDGATFASMDAQRYLDVFAGQTMLDSPVPKADTDTRVYMPWRRFFARTLDLFFYSILWTVILALVFRVNVENREGFWKVLDELMPLGMMLLLEPLQLAWFGATLGKWVLGVSVTDHDGCRLSRQEAFSRTWRVFFYGMGLRVPLLDLYRYYRSYRLCTQGEDLKWEDDSELSLKDSRRWRVAAYAGVCAALFLGLMLAVAVSMQPVNRGNLTVAEFAENYNQQAAFYGYSTHFYLDSSGQWAERQEPGAVYVDLFEIPQPEFSYTVTDGVLTGLAFTAEQQGEERWASLYHSDIYLCLNAFLGAQKGVGIFSRELGRVVDGLNQDNGQGYSYRVGDYDVTCQVAYTGYSLLADGLLVPDEGADPHFTFRFSIQKVTS